MANEETVVTNSGIETQTEQVAGETSKQVSTNPYEGQAREMGWRPKDEWEGEPEKWRDAKEFVERGELYSNDGVVPPKATGAETGSDV